MILSNNAALTTTGIVDKEVKGQLANTDRICIEDDDRGLKKNRRTTGRSSPVD